MSNCKKYLFFFSIILVCHLSGCNSDNSNDSSDLLSPIEDKDSTTHQQEERRTLTAEDIRLQKDIQYTQYSLDDEYPYQDTVRRFQWEKIKGAIALIENAMADGGDWGVLSNYKNMNKEAPTIEGFVRNEYGRVSDQFGIERYQSAPFYTVDSDTALVRYGRDGWLVKLPDTVTTGMIRIKGVSFEGEFLVPDRYIKFWGDSARFDKIVAVDVTNQNISMLEKIDDTWHIVSMNPATTGVHKPPHAHETPTGIFAVQEKKEKMLYVKDGTTEIAGFAPYASRFTNGAYIHGVPVQYPNKNIIEYSPSLGTTPRSHMCVRNASSHAQFVYDRATVKQSVVVVID
jgi:L,D-transpeptidase catalytic domain.